MDFTLTAEQERLRDDVRAFLRETLPRYQREPLGDAWMIGFSREFSRDFAARGWIGFTWPKRYGGSEGSYLERLVITEECLRAGAPVAAHWMSDRQIGPALLAYGNEEQREEFLPRIARAEIVFCIGMSEPNAGSDLASLKTRAVEDGDFFVLDGHKIWTSGAHEADYCYLVARTDAAAPKHKGISELLVDMRSPGITIRPVVDLTGEHHFNEVFFENVRVHRRYLVGEKNRGWYQIASQLDYERSGMERLLSNWVVHRDLRAFATENGLTKDPVLRDKLARVETELELGRWMIYRVAWLLSKGVVPNKESAVTKAFATDVEQHVAQVAGEVLGPFAALMPNSRAAKLAGRVARAILFSPAYTIQGGTSQVLRNIIALRALGLPAS
jgi:alkylation response protein AidB-like acyl-CoA dehydrogenase